MNIITFDYETTGLDVIEPKLVLIAYKLNNDPIKTTTDINIIKPYLESPEWIKCAHHAKFELAVSRGLGINMCQPIYCTAVAAWLLEMGIERPGKSEKGYDYGLKDMAAHHFGELGLKTFNQLAKMYQIEEPIPGEFYKSGKKKGQPKTTKRNAIASEIPIEVLEPYCKKDVELTYKFLVQTYQELERRGMLNLYNMEAKVLVIFAEMEKTGMLMDQKYLQKYQKDLELRIENLEKEMNVYVKEI